MVRGWKPSSGLSVPKLFCSPPHMLGGDPHLRCYLLHRANGQRRIHLRLLCLKLGRPVQELPNLGIGEASGMLRG